MALAIVAALTAAALLLSLYGPASPPSSHPADRTTSHAKDAEDTKDATASPGRTRRKTAPSPGTPDAAQAAGDERPRPSGDRTWAPGNVVITVVDEAGAPCGGAQVDAWKVFAGKTTEHIAETLTDGDGRAILAPKDVYQIDVIASAQGRVSAPVNALLELGRPTRVSLTLRPACEVAGVVVDARGAGVADAEVTLLIDPPDTRRHTGRRTATDTAGRFAFPAQPASSVERALLRVRPQGLPRIEHHLASVPPGRTHTRIVIPDGLRLRLRCVDDVGDPVWPVEVTSSGAVTNPAGGADTADLGRNERNGLLDTAAMPTDHRVVVLTSRRHALTVLTVSPVDGVVDLGDVRLLRGGSVTGRVSVPSSYGGLPLWMRLLAPGTDVVAAMGQVRPDGSFRFDRVGAGAYELVACIGDAPRAPSAPLATVRAGDADVKATLPEPTAVDVRLPAAGKPTRWHVVFRDEERVVAAAVLHVTKDGVSGGLRLLRGGVLRVSARSSGGGSIDLGEHTFAPGTTVVLDAAAAANGE